MGLGRGAAGGTAMPPVVEGACRGWLALFLLGGLRLISLFAQQVYSSAEHGNSEGGWRKAGEGGGRRGAALQG